MKLRSGIFCLVTFAALTVLLGGNLMVSDARAQSQGDWIDVHFHLIANKDDLEGFDEAARAALQIMDAERIQTIVVMSPPIPIANSDFEILANIAKKYGPRIVIFGGGETLNPMLQEAGKSLVVTEEVRRRFEETAQRIIASGAKGFGEITAHHVSMSPSHPYDSVPADHSLLLLLADIAAQHDVPIDLHFDPVPADVAKPSSLSSPLNPAVLKENLGGFERLLAHNRKAKIVWAHAGSDPVGYFTPKLVRELLSRHSNLALSIRPSGSYPGVMVHPMTGAINAEWIAVLSAFPDRFVIGSDNMVVSTRFTGSGTASTFAAGNAMQRLGIRRLLSHLPADLARRIGYENAERLYRLNSTPTFTITGTPSGGNSNLSLLANFTIAPADVSRTGGFYIAAQLTTGEFFFLTPSGFTLYTGGPLPTFSTGTLSDQSITVLSGADVTLFPGVKIYAGYGLNEADFIDNSKYSVIYTVQ